MRYVVNSIIKKMEKIQIIKIGISKIMSLIPFQNSIVWF